MNIFNSKPVIRIEEWHPTFSDDNYTAIVVAEIDRDRRWGEHEGHDRNNVECFMCFETMEYQETIGDKDCYRCPECGNHEYLWVYDRTDNSTFPASAAVELGKLQ
ncbi:MAG TPA: hypothetical protein V6C65_04580 [Allocoleopsis sp.]